MLNVLHGCASLAVLWHHLGAAGVVGGGIPPAFGIAGVWTHVAEGGAEVSVQGPK